MADPKEHPVKAEAVDEIITAMEGVKSQHGPFNDAHRLFQRYVDDTLKAAESVKKSLGDGKEVTAEQRDDLIEAAQKATNKIKDLSKVTAQSQMEFTPVAKEIAKEMEPVQKALTEDNGLKPSDPSPAQKHANNAIAKITHMFSSDPDKKHLNKPGQGRNPLITGHESLATHLIELEEALGDAVHGGKVQTDKIEAAREASKSVKADLKEIKDNIRKHKENAIFLSGVSDIEKQVREVDGEISQMLHAAKPDKVISSPKKDEKEPKKGKEESSQSTDRIIPVAMDGGHHDFNNLAVPITKLNNPGGIGGPGSLGA
jgi:hypothetical protein